MIIYNVTINVDESVHEEWLAWMQNKHINDVLATKKFIKATLVEVLVDEEMGGKTYCVQYFSPDIESLNSYINDDAPRLRQEGLQLFGDKMLAFRTNLKVLREFTL